jgi:hypothetical protein
MCSDPNYALAAQWRDWSLPPTYRIIHLNKEGPPGWTGAAGVIDFQS